MFITLECVNNHIPALLSHKLASVVNEGQQHLFSKSRRKKNLRSQETEREREKTAAAAMMMRLRGQALLMSSSLFRRVSSLSPPPQCCSIRPFSVSCRSLRIASPLSNARLQLRGASIAGSRSSRLSSVRASHQVSDEGSIDSIMVQAMEAKIKEQLNAETVIVKDAYGDGRHVSIYVVSSSFEGQSAVNRQRMVYKAIWEELQSTVHAVDQMITNTPAEANKNQ